MLSLRMSLLIGLCGPAAARAATPGTLQRPAPGALRRTPEPGAPRPAAELRRIPQLAAPPRPAAGRTLRIGGGGGPPAGVLYVPVGFDARPPISVIVFLHGHNNCADNVLREEDGPCQPGGPPRRAHALGRQLDESGRNALLISAETSFDRRSGSPGPLGAPGGLRRLLDEALALAAPPRPGRARVVAPPLGRVALFAHSAGYQAAAVLLNQEGQEGQGGVRVHELYLLDALYGSGGDFAAWIRRDLRSFLGPRPGRRFASLASPGGTGAASEALGRTVLRWLRPLGSPSLAQTALRFELAPVRHAEVPSRYFGWLLAQSGLPLRHRERLTARSHWIRSLWH